MKVEIKEQGTVIFGQIMHGQAFTFQKGFGDHPYLKASSKGVSIAVNLLSGSAYDVEHDAVVTPLKLKVVNDA